MSDVKKKRRSSIAPFKVKLLDSPGHTKDVSDQPKSTEATQGKRLLPNPENIAMDEIIQSIERRIERLKSEENDWYKCFNQLDEQITVADRNVHKTVLSENDVIVKDEIAAEYLYPMRDLDDLSKEVADHMKRSLILAYEHERIVHEEEQKSLEVAAKYEQLFKSFLLQKDQDLTCPIQIIQNIVDLPLVDDGA